MSNSLLTAVSGLAAHQRMLDVVSNNLANLNTVGYKTGRVQFADLLYATLQHPQAGGDNGAGGANPIQVGSGVRSSQITKMFTQGNLEQTGGVFDFAIEGEGFFVVSDGSANLFTRAGTFGVDSGDMLVDLATGYSVQRLGAIGEPAPQLPGFQVPGDSSIRIPFGTTIPGDSTSSIRTAGNLDSQSDARRETILTSTAPFTAGGVAAIPGTLLNDLDSNTAPYAPGDLLRLTGRDADGQMVTAVLGADPTTTVGDLLDAINAAFSGATATLTPDGALALRADESGPSVLALSLTDEPGNAGGAHFDAHALQVSQQGQHGDSTSTSVEVFDARGGAHRVNLEFTKTARNTWDLTASLAPAHGAVVHGAVTGIQFHEDGQFDQIAGTGSSEAALTFRFHEFTEPQTITIQLGQLTQLVSKSDIALRQDGASAGSLVSVSIDSNGVLTGVTTNSRKVPIAQIAMASFTNPQGLVAEGNNYYRESTNSGEARIGGPLSGGRGIIRAGQLEKSNVDLALEFTRLIIAQRGFSANARTISVSDQVLEELVNLAR